MKGPVRWSKYGPVSYRHNINSIHVDVHTTIKLAQMYTWMHGWINMHVYVGISVYTHTCTHQDNTHTYVYTLAHAYAHK